MKTIFLLQTARSILILFIGFFLSVPLNAQVSFEDQTNINIGPSPQQQKAGDFNNDGWIDIVSANSGTSPGKRLSVLLNDSGEGFDVSDISVTEPLFYLDTADFNNDGNLDFVVAPTEDFVGIYLGNGDGTFSDDTINVGDYPNDLKTIDFDKDGNIDIIVLHRFSDDVYILYGDGNGDFESAQVISITGNHTKLCVGDFNNDGNNDFVTGGSSNVQFYAGDGARNYAAAVGTSVSYGFDYMVAEDLDKDGNLDILANSTTFLFSLFGNGDGTFSSGIIKQGTNVSLAADFDADGNMDIVSGIDERIVFFQGDGTVAFPDYIRFFIENTATGISAADWNNDGFLDLAVSGVEDANTGMMQLVYGKGTGYFQTPFQYITQNEPRALVTADFNGDGLEDIAVCAGGSNSDNLYIFEGASDGTFSNSHIYSAGTEPQDLVKLYLNNDTNLDLAVLDKSGNNLVLFAGDGTGSFSSISTVSISADHSLDTADFNGDGNVDLLLAGNTAQLVQVIPNNGDGTLGTSIDIMPGEDVLDAMIIDFNHDGDPDLVYTLRPAIGPAQLNVLQGDGTGNFTSTGVDYALNCEGNYISSGDLDGDGHIDLIISGYNSSQIDLLLGDGALAFSGSTRSSNASDIALFADLDGDGTGDLLTSGNIPNTSSLGTLNVYDGDGTGAFGSNWQESKLFIGGYRSLIADFNDDGLNDIATLSNNTRYDELSILLNDSPPIVCSPSTISPDIATLAILKDACEVLAPSVPTATTNCGQSLTGTTDITFPITTQDTTIVTWTYDDGNGLVSTQEQIVIVLDSITPVPLEATLLELSGECSVSAPTPPEAMDNCTGTITGTANLTFPLTMDTTVIWTYDDGNGNITTQSQEITITDDLSPVPNTADLAEISGNCSPILVATPTSTDNCGGTIQGDPDVSLPISNPGTTIITWTYDDGNGNSSSQMQTVTLNEDIIPPVPVVESLPVLERTCELFLEIFPEAIDDCSGTIEGIPNLSFPYSLQGDTIIVWTYQDASGNVTTQTQLVSIEDTTPPVPDVAMLNDIEVSCSGYTPPTPTAQDDCSGNIEGIPNLSFPITHQGDTTIVWTYEDTSGNISTQIQQVSIGDETPPVPDVAELSDIEVTCPGYTPNIPTAQDDCDGEVHAQADGQFPINEVGTTTITWTYIDAAGNESSQFQQITILHDTVGPTPNIENLLDVTGVCNVNSITAPLATDECGESITGTTDISFPITSFGTTIVTWTFEDQAGNTTTQRQNVVIQDTISPVPNLESLPDVHAECEIDSVTAPTATDNCSGTIKGETSAVFPVTLQGITTITWLFSDESGNVSSQTQNLIIEDVTSPIPDESIEDTLYANCSIIPTSLTANDNCDGLIHGMPDKDFPITGQGTTTVIWTFTDDSGNSSNFSQTIILRDIEPPIPVIDPLPPIYATCLVDLDAPPVAEDLCVGIIPATTLTNSPITEQGITSVTWTYKDGNGNTFTQTQEVIINDTIMPVPELNALPDVHSACAIAAITPPTATDNCGVNLTGTTEADFPISEPGQSTVTWEFDDENGNVVTQIQNVFITPIDPLINFDGNMISAGSGNYSYQWRDCQQNTDIEGEISRTYIPEVSGKYAVEISNGECTVISDCLEVTLIQTSTDEKATFINYYPNPASSFLLFDLQSDLTSWLEIYDNTGKSVLSNEINHLEPVYLHELNPGIYYMRLGQSSDLNKLIIQ